MDAKWKKRFGGGLLLALGAYIIKKTGLGDKAAAAVSAAASNVIDTAVAYVSGRPVGTVQLVSVNGKKVELQTAKQFLAMKAAAVKDGVTLTLASGFRTMAEQRVLAARYLGKRAKNADTVAKQLEVKAAYEKLLAAAPAGERAAIAAGYQAADGNLAAEPGTSNHQNGTAIDIGVREVFFSPEYLWLERNAGAYGFENTGKGFSQPEPWHWERKRVVSVNVPSPAFSGVNGFDEEASPTCSCNN